MKTFKTLYTKLNKEQKEAVDTLEGPVMVIAGPGTGKTQILAMRIANILHKKKTAPEKILALTFSRTGVSAMQKRLGLLAGAQGYYVPVFTFHGFCENIIQTHLEEFPQLRHANSIAWEQQDEEEAGSLNEVEQFEILQEIIQEQPLKLLRPFGNPLYYLRHALSAIDQLKLEGMSPSKFDSKVQKEEAAFSNIPDLYHEKGASIGKMKGKYQDMRRQIEKHKELSLIYYAYQNALITKQRYDYNDMILYVVEHL